MVKVYVRSTFEIDYQMNGGFPRKFPKFYNGLKYKIQEFQDKKRDKC